MSSSEASPSIPFRSKKPLGSSTPKANALDRNLLSSQTPEKPPQLPRRTRNRNVALSLSEVREAAKSIRQSDRNRNQTDRKSSAKRKIVGSPDDETVAGQKVAPKSKNEALAEPKVPEMYEILCDFFNSLDNSIRLIRLKGSTPTFANICRKVESFTDRRFTHKHLAQLKFILPEVIEIKRTLVFDERTSCMKPDLHITMNLEAIEKDEKSKSESGNLYLRRVFRKRLAEFSRSHPEGCEVPEEMLPEPFNGKQGLNSDSSRIPPSADQACDGIPEEMQPVSSSKDKVPDSVSVSEMSSEAPKNQQLAAASHLSHSFRRRFSQKPRSNEVETTSQKSTKLPFKPPVDSATHSSVNPVTFSEETTSNQVFGPTNATPSKKLSVLKTDKDSPRKKDSLESTPAKMASTPARLMAVTPALCPPKRSYMSPEDDSSSTPNKLVRRPPRTRSLKFDSPVKNNKIRDEDLDAIGSSVDNDILDILPENLLQSIRDKERKAAEERDPAISKAKRRKQMIACLPKLFNMIHFLFQSISRSVITKEELMHKILSSHTAIVDRSEVDEQLSLLLELVPDWISEKSASSGDLLFRINKMSSPESVRARLEEAK